MLDLLAATAVLALGIGGILQTLRVNRLENRITVLESRPFHVHWGPKNVTRSGDPGHGDGPGNQ